MNLTPDSFKCATCGGKECLWTTCLNPPALADAPPKDEFGREPGDMCDGFRCGPECGH